MLEIKRSIIALSIAVLLFALVGCSSTKSPAGSSNSGQQQQTAGQTPASQPKSVQDVENLEEKRNKATEELEGKFSSMPWYPLITNTEFANSQLDVHTSINSDQEGQAQAQQICFAIFAHYHGDRNPLVEQVRVLGADGQPIISCPST